MLLNKSLYARPAFKLQDVPFELPEYDDGLNPDPSVRIMSRNADKFSSNYSSSVAQQQHGSDAMQSVKSSMKQTNAENKSIEEREALYQQARARIFEGEDDGSSIIGEGSEKNAHDPEASGRYSKFQERQFHPRPPPSHNFRYQQPYGAQSRRYVNGLTYYQQPYMQPGQYGYPMMNGYPQYENQYMYYQPQMGPPPHAMHVPSNSQFIPQQQMKYYYNSTGYYNGSFSPNIQVGQHQQQEEQTEGDQTEKKDDEEPHEDGN